MFFVCSFAITFPCCEFAGDRSEWETIFITLYTCSLLTLTITIIINWVRVRGNVTVYVLGRKRCVIHVIYLIFSINTQRVQFYVKWQIPLEHNCARHFRGGSMINWTQLFVCFLSARCFFVHDLKSVGKNAEKSDQEEKEKSRCPLLHVWKLRKL